jgi:eukaryotic-like serine/threonine-protein kinase
LKPENIFLTSDGNGSFTVKVLDFGAAKGEALSASGGDATTDTGHLVGTPCYMAPEQVFGERDIDQRSDVWGLGLILYRCLSGLLPTRAETVGQTLKMILARPIWPLVEAAPSVPSDLAAVVDRMVARERSTRPFDLRPVETALLRYYEGERPPIARRPARGVVMAVAALVVLVCLAGALALGAVSRREERSENAAPPADASSAATVNAPPVTSVVARDLHDDARVESTAASSVASNSAAITGRREEARLVPKTTTLGLGPEPSPMASTTAPGAVEVMRSSAPSLPLQPPSAASIDERHEMLGRRK